MNNDTRLTVDEAAQPARRAKNSATQRAPRPAEPREVACGSLPQLLTVDETAALLRTSRKAIYTMVERGQLPGVLRLGRRALFDAAILIDWLRRKRAPSPEE